MGIDSQPQENDMIGKHFKGSARFFHREDPPVQELEIRLESQVHLLRFQPTYRGETSMTPQQHFHAEVISALQDRAREAYHLVLREGIGAVSGQPPEKVAIGEAVDVVIELQAAQIVGLKADIERLDKDCAEKAARIDALERAIARRFD